MKHVVITGIDTALGGSLAELYRKDGARVTGLKLEGDIDQAGLAEAPIDRLIFADDFSAPARRIIALRRGDFEAGLSQLAFLPFRLANQLLQGLTAQGGARLVLLSRRSAAMTEPDPDGSYLERPFRAAAYALWRCFSVEWRPLGIESLIIALDPPCLADTGLLHTIETAVSPADGCDLLDRQGMRLGW